MVDSKLTVVVGVELTVMVGIELTVMVGVKLKKNLSLPAIIFGL